MNTQTSYLPSSSVGEPTTAGLADDRDAAVRRVAHRRQRGFRIYAGVLVAANALVVAFWVVLAVTGQLDLVRIFVLPNRPPLPSGFFWPIFPIAICAVLGVLSWRRAYPRNGYPEEEIQRELTRSETGGMPNHAQRTEAVDAASVPSPAQAEAGTVSGPASGGSTVSARRRGFAVHVLIYLAVSAVLTASWWLGGAGFFWPVFLLTAWGVGVLVNAYLVYRPGSGEGAGKP